jgi:hypothetical protein
MKSDEKTTEELIRRLASEARPVRSLPHWSRRLGLWLILAALCLSAGFSLMNVREDWQAVFREPLLLAQNLLLLLNVLASATAALLLGTPGSERKSLTRFLAVLPLGLWAASFLLMKGTTDNGSGEVSHAEYACALDMVVFAALPALVLLAQLRRGAPLERLRAGFWALLASGGLGAWALQFSCSGENPMHLFVWHFVPLLVLGFGGAWLARLVLRRL